MGWTTQIENSYGKIENSLEIENCLAKGYKPVKVLYLLILYGIKLLGVGKVRVGHVARACTGTLTSMCLSAWVINIIAPVPLGFTVFWKHLYRKTLMLPSVCVKHLYQHNYLCSVCKVILSRFLLGMATFKV